MSLLINITALETREKGRAKLLLLYIETKYKGGKNVSLVTRHMVMLHSTEILVLGILQSVYVNFYST